MTSTMSEGRVAVSLEIEKEGGTWSHCLDFPSHIEQLNCPCQLYILYAP